MTLLPLEKMLQNQAVNYNDFPEQKNYFSMYTTMKEWMKNNVFTKIGSGLSAADGNIYTSHGLDHFDRVIKYAGELLGLEIKDKEFCLNPFEVYVLLVAILLHDSGNMFGRKGHERRAGLIISKMGTLAGSRFEKKIISEVARAHGGEASDGSKDTIGKLNTVEHCGSCSCRSKLIAAITRFADEICEDHTRAASFALENGGIPPKNTIYHKYADAIQSVDVDLADESVFIRYLLDKKDVLDSFSEGDAKSPYLVDEIIYRLKKMDCERRYIMRFTGGVLLLLKTRATIAIINFDDHKYEPMMHTTVVISEEGHPIESLKKSNSCPKWIKPIWTGEKLAAHIRKELSNENK